MMPLNYGVGEDSESPLDCKEIQPVHPKGDQSWIFIERTDAEDETPVLWPPDSKNWFIGKDPDAGKDWWQEEKGKTEDEMVGLHLQLDGHEFEQALGVGDGQGSLACCSPWGCKESDKTKRLNWTESGLPYGSDGKDSFWNSGDLGSVPGSGTSPGAGNCYHFSILAWRIPWTEEAGGPSSIGSQRVGHDWSNLAHMRAKVLIFFLLVLQLHFLPQQQHRSKPPTILKHRTSL